MKTKDIKNMGLAMQQVHDQLRTGRHELKIDNQNPKNGSDPEQGISPNAKKEKDRTSGTGVDANDSITKSFKAFKAMSKTAPQNGGRTPPGDKAIVKSTTAPAANQKTESARLRSALEAIEVQERSHDQSGVAPTKFKKSSPDAGMSARDKAERGTTTTTKKVTPTVTPKVTPTVTKKKVNVDTQRKSFAGNTRPGERPTSATDLAKGKSNKTKYDTLSKSPDVSRDGVEKAQNDASNKRYELQKAKKTNLGKQRTVTTRGGKGAAKSSVTGQSPGAMGGKKSSVTGQSPGAMGGKKSSVAKPGGGGVAPTKDNEPTNLKGVGNTSGEQIAALRRARSKAGKLSIANRSDERGNNAKVNPKGQGNTSPEDMAALNTIKNNNKLKIARNNKKSSVTGQSPGAMGGKAKVVDKKKTDTPTQIAVGKNLNFGKGKAARIKGTQDATKKKGVTTNAYTGGKAAQDNNPNKDGEKVSNLTGVKGKGVAPTADNEPKDLKGVGKKKWYQDKTKKYKVKAAADKAAEKTRIRSNKKTDPFGKDKRGPQKGNDTSTSAQDNNPNKDGEKVSNLTGVKGKGVAPTADNEPRNLKGIGKKKTYTKGKSYDTGFGVGKKSDLEYGDDSVKTKMVDRKTKSTAQDNNPNKDGEKVSNLTGVKGKGVAPTGDNEPRNLKDVGKKKIDYSGGKDATTKGTKAAADGKLYKNAKKKLAIAKSKKISDRISAERKIDKNVGVYGGGKKATTTGTQKATTKKTVDQDPRKGYESGGDKAGEAGGNRDRDFASKMAINTNQSKRKVKKFFSKLNPFSKKEEGMDPVGQGDADINNDGKTDNTDNFLRNRRKAISKKMKVKTDDRAKSRSRFSGSKVGEKAIMHGGKSGDKKSQDAMQSNRDDE